MSEKLNKLRQERDKAERQLRKVTNDQKALAHELIRLTKAERTHRLCTRGGMLETFIREPTTLTDDDVMELLRFLFHSEDAQKKLDFLIESRRKASEMGSVDKIALDATASIFSSDKTKTAGSAGCISEDFCEV